MQLDAKHFTENTTLDTDVCIVGAGPAGLVLASELAAAQCDVLLLESGGAREESDILALNVGDASGDVYAGLSATRHRRIGGTTHLWNTTFQREVGAKYAPLSEVDFRARAHLEHSGWPFTRAELLPYYERAQRTCGLGPFGYEAAAWHDSAQAPWDAIGEHLVSRVYQIGTRDALLNPLRERVTRAANVRLCAHATAMSLDLEAGGRRVTRVRVSTPGGAPWSVRAKRVVLAAGAVENARLLLLAGGGAGTPGNASGWVGRGFMEHPRDYALTLRPRSADAYARSSFYDLRVAPDGTVVLGRIALSDAALASGELLNASITLLPRLNAKSERLRQMLPGFARRWLPGSAHGWTRDPREAQALDGFSLLMNVEQSPHRDNRVTLSARRDSLNVPRPALHWEWREQDQRRLERLRELVRKELGAVGDVRVDHDARPDPNAHHHAGTTRMHDDPAHGVTDHQGRVHGTDNLYAAGASTFPTAGFANPVLTIVAMSLRLARHLVESI